MGERVVRQAKASGKRPTEEEHVEVVLNFS